MKKFTIAVLVTLFAAPLIAASKEPEPVCLPIAAQNVSCKAGDEACAAGQLYVAAMVATNDNGSRGDCKARKLLDDDLFMPLMGVILSCAAGCGDAATIFGHYIPKFRADVATLVKQGAITQADARKLDGMARKLQ